MAAAPLIVAHRGASYDAPENTLAAFRLAWEQGADGIEGDFLLTRDGRLVCLHDDEMKRTAGDPRKVVDLTFDELRQFDVGSWKHERFRGERPPSLAEFLQTVPNGKHAFVELKTGPEIVAPFKAELEKLPIASSQVVVIAFDEQTVRECKRQLPQLRCHWLTSFERENGDWTPDAASVAEAVRRSGADGVGFQGVPEVLTSAFLAASRVAEFHVWTIDDPSQAAYFRQLGVYGVTTNRPGWLREQLSRPE